MNRILAAALAAALMAGPAFAFEKLEGYFIASKACEAYQSKNKLTNPGDITTEASKAYTMLGLNAPGGDFFQIVIPGAPVVEQRWVSTSCGSHVVTADTSVAPQQTTDADPVTVETGPESTDNLLALSWQPAFCEDRKNTTECDQLNAGLLAITESQFSIHGLWPQPHIPAKEYCVKPDSMRKKYQSAARDQLPSVDISGETRDLLNVAMPGTASRLERHEWIKHGTCYRGAGGMEEYFADTLYVTDAINRSVVADFVASQVGKEVSIDDIRARFDEAFGAGAGERVKFTCRKEKDGARYLLTEIQIGLVGTIHPEASVGELIRAAKKVSADCRTAIIDPAGLQ